MKSIIKIPKEVQNKAIKKTVDGIIDTIIRAHEANYPELDFEVFVRSIPYMKAEEFMNLTTKKTELLSEETDA